MELGRLQLLEQNVIHEFDSALVRRNLRGCYGKITAEFYRSMFTQIVGTRVLDVGCGFGLFSHLCRLEGFQVDSIDIDEQSLAIAREVFNLECRFASVYESGCDDQSIDTIVFNDVICHLEFPKLAPEIHRLGAKRLLVFDSNIANPFLGGYRRLAGHEEFHDYTLSEIVAHTEGMGFRNVRSTYHNYLGLPISGGLQRNPIPVLHRFPRTIAWGDRVLKSVMPWTLLNRFLAFRFLAIFDRKEP